jgi:hypothetical protein
MGWSFDDKKTQAYINKAIAENAVYQPIDKQLGYAWKCVVQSSRSWG